MDRRHFLGAAGLVPAATALSRGTFAQSAARPFNPDVGAWRTFDITTKIELVGEPAGVHVWVPLPNVNSDWQHSADSRWSGNASVFEDAADARSDARVLHATWTSSDASPRLEVVSRIRTRDRQVEWNVRDKPEASPAERVDALRSTTLIPTDGIVRATAKSATRGQSTDVGKARALYDWVVQNTYREPAVRGCGVGDIKAMLETRNMGGKCADLNALYVGLCRSVGVPARDLYGIRVAKSKFPYKELGAGNANIAKAQHCRADIWLADYGWAPSDPADVAKVMRQETAEWIRSAKHEVVAPVYSGLFGGWEGNWMAYNTAHDVKLPGSKLSAVPFLMYPQAEVRGERVDSLDPETFVYTITAQEVMA